MLSSTARNEHDIQVVSLGNVNGHLDLRDIVWAAYRKDFANVLEVFDWLRQGVVLVHKDTPAKGKTSKNKE